MITRCKASRPKLLLDVLLNIRIISPKMGSKSKNGKRLEYIKYEKRRISNNTRKN